MNSRKSARETVDVPILVNELRQVRDDASILSKDARAEIIRNKLDSMSEEELTRLEFFVRSHFPRNRIRDIIASSAGVGGDEKAISEEMVIVVAGLAKLFVGELIDQAVDIANSDGGPPKRIRCKHIEDAHRRMQRDGKIGRCADNQYLFQSSYVPGAELFDDIGVGSEDC